MTSLANAARQTEAATRRLHLPVGPATFGMSWLLVIPIGTWAIAVYLVPLLAPSLDTTERWLVAAAAMLLVAGSSLAHTWAHLFAASALETDTPEKLPVTLFGDAAQAWPESTSPLRDVTVAISGPVANFMIAVAGWMAWNAQVSPHINAISVTLGLFNLALAAYNFTPVLPFDGGRIAGAALRGLGEVRFDTNRALRLSGFALAVAVAAWGVFLLAQDARFSPVTGAAAFLVAVVMLSSLTWHRGPARMPVARTGRRNPLVSGLGISAAAALIVVLMAPFVAMLPVNDGITAPGSALSTEEMVIVPPELRHEMSGSFYALTVIPQAPITAFLWMAAKVSPVIDLVPPERVVPHDVDPQTVALQQYNALITSEATAIVVALRLAGFDVSASGEGAFVNSVLDTSPAEGLLLPGDVIVEFEGHPVTTSNELVTLVRTADHEAQVEMKVSRDGEIIPISTSLIPPVVEGDPPRIGIAVETANLDYDIPFPVEISERKITGGPSAGLMFTLTVYDLVTEEDLAGGRKIAGTGTIDFDGNVGPIGGVRQKVAAAESAGAEYFLCPPSNCADAREVATDITVVEVETAEAAIEFLRSLPVA